ncbi:hypothetical protein KAX97_05475, partial [candidate division WOR-3 bacterium]|nr:hypothetical protein [candidate division WOR-3 bacterium]
MVEQEDIEVPDFHGDDRIRCFYDDDQTNPQNNPPIRNKYIVVLDRYNSQLHFYLGQTDDEGYLYFVDEPDGNPVDSDPPRPYDPSSNVRFTFTSRSLGPAVTNRGMTLSRWRTEETTELLPQFFLWPRPNFEDRDFRVSIRYGIDNGVSPDRDSLRRIEIPCRFPIWVERIREKTEELYEIFTRHLSDLNRLGAIHSFYNEAKVVVEARARERFDPRVSPNSDAALREHEYVGFMHLILDTMINFTGEYFRTRSERLEQIIGQHADELWNLLQSPMLSREYNSYDQDFTGRELDGYICDVFRDAYVILSRTRNAETIYSAHLGPHIRSGFDNTVETAQWVEKFGSRLVDICNAYIQYSRNRQIFDYAEDILHVANHMQDLHYMQNVDELGSFIRQTRDYPMIRFDRTQVDWDRYFTSRMPVGAINSMKAGISGLVIIQRIRNRGRIPEVNSAVEDLQIVRDGISFGRDITQIPRLQRVLPNCAVQLSRRAGVVGDFLDVGLAGYNMFNSAEEASGEQFACDVVIYMGKVIIVGGSITTLTGAGALPGLVITA